MGRDLITPRAKISTQASFASYLVESVELKFEPITAKGNFISGQFRRPYQPEGNFEKKSPANYGDHLGLYEWSRKDVELAVEAAQKSLPLWNTLGLDGRTKYLRKLQETFKSKRQYLAETLSRDVGKSLWESLSEVDALSAKIDITLQEGVQDTAGKTFENLVGTGTRGGYKYKPLGVVAVLGPFNFPAHLPNGHWIPALAMGNTVIFKPSEFAPATAQVIAECFSEAGFPEGVFNMVHGAREVGESLVVHPKVMGVFFTGSYNAGRSIKAATLNQPQKLLALEMGGKNSTVVAEDANLDLALSETIQSSFLTSGQRCSATSRIFVHEKLFEVFKTRFVELTNDLVVDHPFKNPFMGPLIHEKSKESYVGAIESLKTKPRFRLLNSLNPKSNFLFEGAYVRPTVSEFYWSDLLELTSEEFFKEEIFAPHVTLIPFKKMEDAIAGVNSTPYGLVSSLFSNSEKSFEDYFNKVDCGLINWNKGTVGASSKLPFGGIKKSGNYFPSALFASRYCGYPVSFVQNPKSEFVKPNVPGMNWRSVTENG